MYAKAVELATKMEAAERNSQQLKGAELPVQQKTQQSSAGKSTKDLSFSHRSRGQVASQILTQTQVTLIHHGAIAGSGQDAGAY